MTDCGKETNRGGGLTLADIPGAECVNHLWITADTENIDGEPNFLRKLLLKMYWDGEEEPSVLVPLGDFFGTVHVEDPMTFERSIRVTVEHGHANKRSDDYSLVAYWYQTEPHKPFSILPGDERIPRPA